MLRLFIFNYLCLVLSAFSTSHSSWADTSMNASEVEERLSEIAKTLNSLPIRPVYPVGGVRGYKWSKELNSPWVELHFPEKVTLDSLAVVPLATFKVGKVESYAMSPKIKITLLGVNKVIFEGETLKHCREANPLFLEFKNNEEGVEGIRIELLSNQCEAPYLALNEVFAFSQGLNVALGANVKGNSDLRLSDISNHPQNLVNGQSNLGQPIFKDSHQNKNSGFIVMKFKAKGSAYLEFMFAEPRPIHEVRLYSLYAPTNQMLIEQYGMGFPVSFRLVGIDKDANQLFSLHEGPFFNPGRNLTSFYASSKKAAGIRIYIDEFYKRPISKKVSFNLSEIQILDDNNQNLATKSIVYIKGIPNSNNKQDQNWWGHLVDGQTPQGRILGLEEWLKQLAYRNTLNHEKKSLIQLQGKLLAERTLWFQIISVLFIVVLLIFLYGWYLSKMKQKQRLRLVRKDIANDLHDEIGSNLASIRLIASRLSSEKPVETIKEILDESEEALREMVWALSPQQISFLDKINESANRLLPEHQVTINIESSEDWEHLHLKDRQHVVFWFKEALNNIQKHAEAKKVDIQFKRISSSEHLELIIKDNGKGMDLNSIKEDYDHLARLKARALKLTGEFKVRSNPGDGFEVSLVFKSQNKL